MIGGGASLQWRLWRSARNVATRFAREQRLRAAAVTVVVAVMWALVAGLVLGLLAFLGQPEYIALKQRLLESLLALFFFSLYFLVAISDAVLVWSALFRTRSAAFHASLPISDRAVFWAAFIEGGFWASWAVMALAVPMMLALATETEHPLGYALSAAAIMLAFVACCMSTGSILAMAMARAIPLLRRHARIFLGIGAALVGLLAWMILRAYDGEAPGRVIGDVVGRLRFAESPYLPAGWAQQAMIAALAGRWGMMAYHVALMATTACALAVAAEWLAGRRFRRDLDALSGRTGPRGSRSSRPWRLLPLLPRDLSLLVAKDLRIFLREPAQVMQFSMFFGMLAFYMLMLPRLGHAFRDHDWWRPAVSILNLTAVAMALATFTGRFVYPLLSLEGRRLWVLALAPWPRERVVTAKLIFALVVGLPVSVGLVTLSGTLLELAPTVIAYQMLVIGCMSVGLSAGALGLGARLADYTEDNSAKLVAGYGGTVNLLASLVFSGMLIVGAALPMVMRHHPGAWVAGIVWTVGISGAWSAVCMRVAWRWFGRL
jgi:ABC-2 type transport system permease protein